MDMASEMLYPIMPAYLSSIGFTALWIGILEGLAEMVVGLSKGYFGKLSDLSAKRLPFVRLGYFLSALSKPMMAIFIYPVWILLSRSADRLGKGLRSGARDALLSDESSKENKGKVFGFHRGMDTLGAAIGPLLALAYLYYHPKEYATLFYIAFIPAIASVILTFFIREPYRSQEKHITTPSLSGFFSYFSYWKESPALYRRLLIGLLAFSLFNSSDIFLLLMAKHAGIGDTDIIIVYVFYNLVYALFSYPMGWLADKLGMKKIFLLGLLLFAGAYIGMAYLKDLPILYALFFLYGLYAAATEGIYKAWIARTVDTRQTATAIGLFQSCSSISTLVASTTAGLLWVSFLPETTFLVSGAGAILVLFYFFFRVGER